jgi:predicted SAM-dependent methyltransferase
MNEAAAAITPIAASIMQSPPPCPCNSGKTFDMCHGSVPLPPEPQMFVEKQEVRLDLGCGQSCQDGFEGVDLWSPTAKHRVNLFRFPWRFEDSSVDEIYCSHFVEHIPAREVEDKDIDGLIARDFIGKDMLFAFFDECHRILKPRGKMKVIVPALQSTRAFQDPTHRRFIPAEMFGYLSKEWRTANKLDHYRVVCDFEITINHTVLDEMNLLAPEVAMRRFRESWNTMWDFHADLVKKG